MENRVKLPIVLSVGLFLSFFLLPLAFCSDLNFPPDGPKDFTVFKVDSVEVHSSDTDTHKIESVLGANGKDHFVCVKGTGDIILNATLNPDTTETQNAIMWEADGAIITSPSFGTDKTTAKLSSAAWKKIPVRIKVGDCTCWEGIVWVLWSTASATENSIVVGNTTVTTGDNTNGPGIYIRGGYDYTFTINPGSIITDTDRPDLSGANLVQVPGASRTHVISGNALAGGADKKWDASRQIRIKILNPHLYSKNVLPQVSGHLWNGQPASTTTPESYPSDPALGNDDTTTNDPENNDPYSNNGKISATDTPTTTMRNSTGSDDDTFERRYHFIEFLRINLKSNWYRASGDYPWRVHFKYKKVGETWINNGSSQAQNNTGF